MLAIATLIRRISLRVRIDLSAQVGDETRREPAKALERHKVKRHLPPELLAECAARAPSDAIRYIGMELPPELLKYCQSRTS